MQPSLGQWAAQVSVVCYSRTEGGSRRKHWTGEPLGAPLFASQVAAVIMSRLNELARVHEHWLYSNMGSLGGIKRCLFTFPAAAGPCQLHCRHPFLLSVPLPLLRPALWLSHDLLRSLPLLC